MPLQIIEFHSAAHDGYGVIPVPDGLPLAITAPYFTGEYTVGGNTAKREERIVQFTGEGSIAWPGLAEPEQVSSPVARVLRAGTQFTVS